MNKMESLFLNSGLDLITDKILQNLDCQELASLELSSPDIARYFVQRHVWKRRWIKLSKEYLLSDCRCSKDAKCLVCQYNHAEVADFLECRPFRSLCYHYFCGLSLQWKVGKPLLGYNNKKAGGVLADASLVGTNSLAVSCGGNLYIARILDGLKSDCRDCVQKTPLSKSFLQCTVHLQYPPVYKYEKGARAIATNHDVLLVADDSSALTWWHVDNAKWLELWNLRVPPGDSIRAVALSTNLSLSMCHLRTIKVWKLHWQATKSLSRGKNILHLWQCSASTSSVGGNFLNDHFILKFNELFCSLWCLEAMIFFANRSLLLV